MDDKMTNVEEKGVTGKLSNHKPDDSNEGDKKYDHHLPPLIHKSVTKIENNNADS